MPKPRIAVPRRPVAPPMQEGVFRDIPKPQPLAVPSPQTVFPRKTKGKQLEKPADTTPKGKAAPVPAPKGAEGATVIVAPGRGRFADGEEVASQAGARSGQEWGKGLVKFEDAMEIVALNVSEPGEVDVVEEILRAKILGQKKPRHAEPLKHVLKFPNGEPKRYIMRRQGTVGTDDDMPFVPPQRGELIPTRSGGWDGEPPPPLQVELLPVK